MAARLARRPLCLKRDSRPRPLAEHPSACRARFVLAGHQGEAASTGYDIRYVAIGHISLQDMTNVRLLL